jgi:hypothetical protein
MATVNAWKEGDPSAPDVSSDFEELKKAVLQVTDIKTNRNKYYAIELHQAGESFRVFTHYGQTEDLETNPEAGAKERRFFDEDLSSSPDSANRPRMRNVAALSVPRPRYARVFWTN